MIVTPQEVLDFWFVECEPADWFKKSEEFDNEIRFSRAMIRTQKSRWYWFLTVGFNEVWTPPHVSASRSLTISYLVNLLDRWCQVEG